MLCLKWPPIFHRASWLAVLDFPNLNGPNGSNSDGSMSHFLGKLLKKLQSNNQKVNADVGQSTSTKEIKKLSCVKHPFHDVSLWGTVWEIMWCCRFMVWLLCKIGLKCWMLALIVEGWMLDSMPVLQEQQRRDSGPFLHTYQAVLKTAIIIIYLACSVAVNLLRG